MATSDGTATAGSDYTATSGTLSFAAGETEKTVSVPVLDDAHDEGSETLTLTLSNPSGAYLADGSATGTITNSDPMPLAWMVRFGRTVGNQVVDALTGRLEGGSGAHITVGGVSLSGGGKLKLEEDEPTRKLGLPEWTEREPTRRGNPEHDHRRAHHGLDIPPLDWGAATGKACFHGLGAVCNGRIRSRRE